MDTIHFDLYLQKLQECKKPETTISQYAVSRWNVLIFVLYWKIYIAKECNFIWLYYEQAVYSKVILLPKLGRCKVEERQSTMFHS